MSKRMKAPLKVETARLILAAPVAEDADAIFDRYASDPEVTRYWGWPRHRGLVDTHAFLAFGAAQWEETGAGPYLIRLRGDDRVLGSSGLGLVDAGGAMTGYVLA